MPYPNEHACRLRDPGDFEADSFRRVDREHEGKSYAVIMGRLEGDETMTEQAYRYPKGAWDAGEARTHCEAHDGIEFAPAAEGEAASQRLGESVERRTVTARELRVVDGDAGPVIEGYAAVFGEWSEDLGGFREMVREGAFSKTIQEADVRALWNHDPNYVLGRVSSGTLTLTEDQVGLWFAVAPPDTSWARDLMVTMRRGDVSQMSFGFEKVRDVWEQDDEELTRTLVEVRLYDVSPVTFPAYPQTSAEVRKKVASMQEADAPGQEPHPEALEGDEGDSARARLDVRRRRLELNEVETYLFGGDD